jgi:alpha-tubulin suppressor-like RCC1 family protein
MLGSRYYALLAAGAFALVGSACRDEATSPNSPQPAFAISDATKAGGNPHFFWLPPMVHGSTPAGTFDPMLDAEVSICQWSGSACVGDPIVRFSRHTGEGSELLRVELGDQQYIVNWHLDRYGVEPGRIYRISVIVDGTVLGFADVQVEADAQALKNVDTNEYIPVKEGRTVPIKFRIEEGVLPAGERTPVVLGIYHACFLDVEGAAWCSGNNFYGQLGTGSAGSNSSIPVRAAQGHVFKQLTVGLWHTCGRKSDGSVWCWGYAGARATGPIAPLSGIVHLAPVQVTGIPSAQWVTAGYEHTCVLTDGGEAWCWGANFHGQLGRGFTSFPGEGTPVRAGTELYDQLGAGYLDTCGRMVTGQVQCWGYNGFGEHGDNTFTRHPSPSFALGTHTTIAVGEAVVCSLDDVGAASCWGWNEFGALGRGFAAGSGRTPQPVLTTLRFRQIAPGGTHTCAIATPGDAAYCWGSGWGLGTGSLLNTTTPGTPVAGERTWSAMSVNDHATCGVTTEGTPLCWGQNSAGELGTGSFAFSQPNPNLVAGGHVVAIE